MWRAARQHRLAPRLLFPAPPRPVRRAPLQQLRPLSTAGSGVGTGGTSGKPLRFAKLAEYLPAFIEAHGHCWIAPTYTAPDGYCVGADAQVSSLPAICHIVFGIPKFSPRPLPSVTAVSQPPRDTCVQEARALAISPGLPDEEKVVLIHAGFPACTLLWKVEQAEEVAGHIAKRDDELQAIVGQP